MRKGRMKVLTNDDTNTYTKSKICIPKNIQKKLQKNHKLENQYNMGNTEN